MSAGICDVPQTQAAQVAEPQQRRGFRPSQARRSRSAPHAAAATRSLRAHRLSAMRLRRTRETVGTLSRPSLRAAAQEKRQKKGEIENEGQKKNK